MAPRFFASAEEMRAWLREHHERLDEQWVGYRKKGSGLPSVTWPESVDVALCFGWIDGIRKSLDGTSYAVRFTPRRRGSVWSARNVARMTALLAAGLVEPAGQAAFAARKADESAAPKSAVLPQDYQERLEAHADAWSFFQSLRPSYRRQSVAWIVDAKRDETRLRRLDTLIACCARGRLVPPLRWAERRS